APDDKLVPRVARNIARADLAGEQLRLSHSLARRAIELGEPVVAVDAAGEMPSLHASVHALKLRSVLAIPLVARGSTVGVVYLDDRMRRGAFGAKELVARAIHANGARGGKTFVGENCAAIPEPLLESTLFGHARGAFTGADRARPGLFEVAHQGTLFLDEIGEMSLPMQAKLLRVLEEGEVHPLGADRGRRIEVRVVAATHRNLDQMVRD